MTLFQGITLPLVSALLVRSIRKLTQSRQRPIPALMGAALWLAAGIAIIEPELMTRLAKIVGIGRGADLVLYFFVIIFMILCFYFYNTCQKLQSDISEIVRHLALQEALQRWPEKTDDIDPKGISGRTLSPANSFVSSADQSSGKNV